MISEMVYTDVLEQSLEEVRQNTQNQQYQATIDGHLQAISEAYGALTLNVTEVVEKGVVCISQWHPEDGMEVVTAISKVTWDKVEAANGFSFL
jgi:hypothetical protein